MIKNEEYKKILKMMESCVSHGDYCSVKELSNLELEVMNLKEKNTKKEVKKYTKKLNTKEKIDIMELANLYSTYILEKIENAKNLSELQAQTISFEEFLKYI